VIGLWHEHARPDRDDYVNIYLNNVNSADEDNFDKETTTYALTLGVPYDYGSVMHYSFSVCCNNNSSPIELYFVKYYIKTEE
jgi:meprin B